MAEWRSSFILTAKVFRVIPICTFFCAQSSRWLADPALSGFDRKIKASNFGFRKLRAKGNWCPIRSLFLFIFGLFQTLIPNFYNKLCEKMSIQCWRFEPKSFRTWVSSHYQWSILFIHVPVGIGCSSIPRKSVHIHHRVRIKWSGIFIYFIEKMKMKKIVRNPGL